MKKIIFYLPELFADGEGAFLLPELREVMTYFNIYSEEKRKHWYAMFKNGTKPPKDFWTSP